MTQDVTERFTLWKCGCFTGRGERLMHHVETERLCPLHTAASEMLEFIRLVAIGAEGALSARALLGKIHARALLAKIEGAP